MCNGNVFKLKICQRKSEAESDRAKKTTSMKSHKYQSILITVKHYSLKNIRE